MKKRTIIVLCSIAALILVLMAVSTMTRNKSGFVADAVGVITTPVEKLFQTVSNGISGGFGYFKTQKTLREENSALQSRVDILEENNRELEDLKSENERLRALLDMKDKNPAYTMVGATVVSQDSTKWSRRMMIDKGTMHGLAVNDAVITSDGLVGHIEEVGSNWARIITILDADSSCGAVIQRTNDRGLIEGDLELAFDGLCKMTYITKNANLVPGDYVETSGTGEIYPPDLYVGKVREVTAEEQGISQTAVIEPAVDFDKVSEVLVVIDYTHSLDTGE